MASVSLPENPPATVAVPGRPVPARRQVLTLAGAAIAAMLFYAIAFPKGGIKVFGVPLTFGYAMTAAMMLIACARAERVGASLDRIIALIPCVLLGVWSLLVVRTNGSESAGFTTAYFVAVVYLPLFGLIFFSPAILDEHNDRLERTFVWAVRAIIVYGIFLFLFKQATGRWIEVPYLTVNADDAGNLDEKYINRGGIFKLISTYNNGNIFGVSIAMMAPLYLLLEPRKLLRWALYAAVVLTLSRTVWIGLMLVVALRSLSQGVRPLTVLSLLVGLTLGMVAVYGALSLIGLDLAFLFDRNLGGRATQLVVLNHVEFIPTEIVGAIPEIVYLGVLKFYGLPGLLLFLIYILVVPLLLWLEGVRLLSMSRATACMQGMLIYAVLAGADGAFNYIPVMMIFWMIAGWGFWYARRQALGTRSVAARSVVGDRHAAAR